MSNQALFEKLDQTTEILSTKLGELVKLASLDPDENDTSLNAISTTGLLMVNSQTMQLVKGVQDLLVLTRNIREKWLLNQIPEQGTTSGSEVVQDPAELEELLDQCLQEVIGEQA
ncbi:SRB6 (YBR253W) [Zygosaccharomyces parabailii]|uniref:Mediator of RNA polymerase II transcription subunit 22 n=1 Tax=Zygosaccharomyces bailii (strain CLIB 213 / ATCC 58445 / CBS 680 / BCRC 21525 / NBRC 1098 / NCYC 1416 / NRRL Y-2227) TaxID=1333698 RepID=A0A8J2T4N2_ZYGB2|nr:SRB6 (YBR253W) [Zygosaccharomyces parabailii]CDF88124.1 BN860_02872g1_1 [Zygosaccharomyces bailii CLIB 213]CDH09046.1 related to Mediator of RNA polymerase II transcription subunit 22 [Zygosaccharomyces bailii ISA1307]